MLKQTLRTPKQPYDSIKNTQNTLIPKVYFRFDVNTAKRFSKYTSFDDLWTQVVNTCILELSFLSSLCYFFSEMLTDKNVFVLV